MKIENGARILLAITASVFVYCELNWLFNTVIFSGESAILSNVIIDYVREGVWHYPVHAQHLFYPGVEKFMIHPPLHYFFASQWVSIFGIGVWQLHLQSTLAGIIACLGGAFVVSKTHTSLTGFLSIVLSIISASFIFSSLEIRPDMSFGFFYTCTVAAFGFLLLSPLRSRVQSILTFVFGLLIAACLATHWFGYFVQFYLLFFAAATLHRSGKNGIRLILINLSGWLFGMAIWYAAFQEDFFPSLIFVLIKGNNFRSSLAIPMVSALEFLLSWAGGLWLSIGLLLALAIHVPTAIRSVAKNVSMPIGQKVSGFLLWNILAYVIFFYFMVGNKGSHYAANVLFLLIPLSAIGYTAAFSFISNLIGRPKLAHVAAMVLGGVMVFTSPVVRSLADHPTWSIERSNNGYADVRRALEYLVPVDASLIVGGNAYPYLYDRNYESTMLLVARQLLKDPGPLPLSELVSFYRSMSTKQYSSVPFLIDDRRKQIGQADYIVVADSGHSWQNLFLDPKVWSPGFTNVAAVTTRSESGQRALLFPGYESNYSSTFQVYSRHKFSLDRIPEASNARLLQVGNEALIIAPGTTDRHAIDSMELWKTLSAADRRKRLSSYFDALKWYGSVLELSQKEQIVDRLLPFVSGYLESQQDQNFNGVKITRTLGNAVDHAFTVAGLPGGFPRIPEREWKR